MIKLNRVSFRYKNGINALQDINLEIDDGEFVYITGTTGSGKSTLIRLLNTEFVPTKGSIIVNDVNIGKIKYSKVPFYRRSIGVVFQDYRLIPTKTVYENVAFALEVVDTPIKKLRRRTKEVIKLVGLQDKCSSLPDYISGGQQQRVAIARAIANHPKVLIADEPTGNLDPETSEGIISLFENINKEEGTTIIIVTHDADIVRKHPKRTIKIESGHIVDDRYGINIDDVEKAEMELTRQLQITREEEFKKMEEEYMKIIEEEEKIENV